VEKEPLGYAKERDRQNRQRGRLTRAIFEVQTDALNRRNDEAASDEDLYNNTVAINWMPLLFDAMGAPGADPDVKRMALAGGSRQGKYQPDILRWRHQAAVGCLRRRIQSPTDTVGQGQSGQVYLRHAAAIFSGRRDAGRSRDRMHSAHARMVVPQPDV
jgi:hypothetical protein